MNYALLCSYQRECVLTVANEVRLSTRRGKAEAKELPSPLTIPNPYDVRGGDIALLTQSVAGFYKFYWS